MTAAPRHKLVTVRSGRRKTWDFPTPLNGLPSQDIPSYAQYLNKLHVSSGHKISQLGGPGNIGGPFWCVTHDLNESGNCHSFQGQNGLYRFDVGQYPVSDIIGEADFPVVIPSSDTYLDALGTSIIARILPTNPVFNGAQALGEAREGFPSRFGHATWQNRTRYAKSAGDEYINVQFGWKPLINDIQGASNAAKNYENIVKQFLRNSGRRIKRRVKLDAEIETSTGKFGGSPTPVMGVQYGLYNGSGEFTWTQTKKTERWFSGCFTYFVPPAVAGAPNLDRQNQIRNHVFGTRVTPETLWNLTPWTWAADWFANTGDVLRNISAFQHDGLVMPYGYMMERKTVSIRYDLVQPMNYGYGNVSLFQELVTTSKYRRAATPYGFGTTGDLSPQQIAILAALGLTRFG